MTVFTVQDLPHFLLQSMLYFSREQNLESVESIFVPNVLFKVSGSQVIPHPPVEVTGLNLTREAKDVLEDLLLLVKQDLHPFLLHSHILRKMNRLNNKSIANMTRKRVTNNPCPESKKERRKQPSNRKNRKRQKNLNHEQSLWRQKQKTDNFFSDKNESRQRGRQRGRPNFKEDKLKKKMKKTLLKTNP